jgi:GNAT superfamily N-acetyltransferase
MIELTQDQYYILKTVCPDNHSYVEVPMIINDRRGRVWVDDIENPRLATLWCGDLFFIEGDGDENLVYEPLSEVAPKVLEIACERNYRETVSRVFTNVQDTFNVFFRHDKIIRNLPLPEGFEIVPIDKLVYEHLNDTGENWLVAMYRNYEDFKNTIDLGYAAMRGRDLISAAVPYGYDGKRVNIGVGTRVDFRSQGLSSACVSALIADLIERRLQPIWITGPDNPTSRKVAEKNGFTEIFRLPIFWTEKK